jgi:hypothetical protein
MFFDKKIKVFESSTDVDDYRLQYFYFYVISSDSEFELIFEEKSEPTPTSDSSPISTDLASKSDSGAKSELPLKKYQQEFDDIVIVNYFNYKGKYYLIFWAKKEKDGLNIKHTKDLYITHFLIKTEDSYVLDLGGKRGKPFSDIKDLQKQQFLDLRKFMDYKAPVILSSIWLNILLSNKLLYYQYFIEQEMILNTTIKHMSISEINRSVKENKNIIIKSPYSSASGCVTIFNMMNHRCFVGEGVIVSEKNKSVRKYELKIHTFKGKILYCMVKGDKEFTFNKKFKVVKNNFYTENSKDELEKRMKYINKYKDEIIENLKSAYNHTNRFVILMKYKLKYELEKFIIPLGLDKTLFFGFFYTKKKELLKEKIDQEKDNKLVVEYLEFLELTNDEVSKKLNIKYSKKKYTDYYLRVDLMLPDYEKYDKVSLIEVEPFACGKGFVVNIKDAMHMLKSPYNPESAQSIVFAKYFQKILKIDHKLEWEKMNPK